jgi:hypothetical protein
VSGPYGTFPGWPSKTAYTFQPGSDYPSGRIVKWDNTTPDGGNSILLQIAGNPLDPTSIPIREIYLPVIYGAINFYIGQTTTVGGTIDYTTQGSGCETVDFDGVFFVVLEYVGGYPGQPAYVFLRNLPTGAFRTGPLGAQVTTVTATAPIVSSGGSAPNISLEVPLAVIYGGTGTTAPQLIAGSGITITGTDFDWTISSSGGNGIQDLKITNSASPSDPPANVTNPTGPTTTINFNTPFDLTNGGTGFSAPGYTNGSGLMGNPSGAGIAITDNTTIFDPSSWTFTNTGVLSCIPYGNPGTSFNGDVLFESSDGSLNIVKDTPNNALDFTIATPIGFTIVCPTVGVTAGQINAGVTLHLGTLPAGTWFVSAICHGFGLGLSKDDSTCVGNTINMACGGGFSGADSIIQCQETRTLYQCNSVPSGNSPNITLTGAGVTLNTPGGTISVGFTAVRTA